MRSGVQNTEHLRIEPNSGTRPVSRAQAIINPPSAAFALSIEVARISTERDATLVMLAQAANCVSIQAVVRAVESELQMAAGCFSPVTQAFALAHSLVADRWVPHSVVQAEIRERLQLATMADSPRQQVRQHGRAHGRAH